MVEFAARLPHRFKVGKRDGRWRAKYLPRVSYQRAVGPDAAWSPKLGMGANLGWHREFATNPKFQAALAGAFAALRSARINVTAFQTAYAEFAAAIAGNDATFPSGSTMMNGFMLGRWLQQSAVVEGPGA
jgi:hypothetical protein